MGAWTFTDDGDFELDPTVEQYLEQAHEDGRVAYQNALTLFIREKSQEGAETVRISDALRAASEAWQEAVFDYINEYAPVEYTHEQLHAELLKRADHENVTPEGVCDGLIIDAIEGELC